MTDRFLSKIQSFLNSRFTYRKLCEFTNIQRGVLLCFEFSDLTKEEYNSLFELLSYLELYFEFSNKENTVVGTNISVKYKYSQILENNKKNYKNLAELKN
jgi:hypothetical protein